MRHAILIHAHRFPEQFGRLCRALIHPDFDIYANIDAKSGIEPFMQVAPQATFIKERTDIRWGRWSQVEATLNSLKEIIATGKEYGYVIFISGQDYPVKSLDEISRILDQGKDAEYIQHDTDLTPEREKEFIERYSVRQCYPKNLKLRQVSHNIGLMLPRRKSPFPIIKGPQWWTLSINAINYVLDFCRDNPKVVRRFHKTWCSDEMFFQMILYASPFRDKITYDYKRHIDWTAPEPFNPKVLTEIDFPAITKGDAWFTRKIDESKDGGLMDMLDKHREKN